MLKPGDVLSKSSVAFATTAWTVVLQAKSDHAHCRLALEQLCQSYWYPVYAFARRSGLRASDAEDATQSFFAWLLESKVVDRADPTRGRFRSFLVTAFRQFLSRRREYDQAAKRRPDRPVMSLSLQEGEHRFEIDPCHDQTPERIFEHAWAMAAIEQAMRGLRLEWEQAGKGERFEALKSFLTCENLEGFRELAPRLNMSEGALRVAIHRLRRRFGEIMREEIGQTLEAEEDIDEELQCMMKALKT